VDENKEMEIKKSERDVKMAATTTRRTRRRGVNDSTS
jgi:hypothetical protein